MYASSFSNVRGIIFDMDNTLLQSNIDFGAMKSDIYEYLMQNAVLESGFPVKEHTTATLIEHVRQTGKLTDSLYYAVMDIAAEHELRGMEGAGLEPGAEELLAVLHQRYQLAIVTNNSIAAAREALERTGIISVFDLVVGREQMASMKPNPAGFVVVKETLRFVGNDQWLSVGDAWIDGKASADAGIPFISYRTGLDVMHARGVRPIGRIDRLSELIPLLEKQNESDSTYTDQEGPICGTNKG
ncbi:HAD family hydrolase [Paenibacillus mendelii]|uniref:HAD family hydrolase n=1 Tax=Paenibacillus mendelii TaxID=206163 RepID=A0ABV6JD34_9BACL|nr:HAD-IA family hydrolase [Paenibacillus mendelii]MCQ6562432.1 HAD-IA family hydrolase [Paenibacillus mendelii]